MPAAIFGQGVSGWSRQNGALPQTPLGLEAQTLIGLELS